jgi:hypothetical protein
MTVPPKEKQPLSCRFLREQNTGIPLRLAHPERIQLSVAREKRKSEIPVFSTSFRNRNDSGGSHRSTWEKQPLSCRLLRQQNTVSRCALHIPRESGSSLPVKSVKARFRYSPLCSETGMTVGFSSVYVGKTAHVMPVIAPAKYRYPAVPCASREIPALRCP